MNNHADHTTPAPCCGPDCCQGETKTAAAAREPDVREKVREGYAAIAEKGVWLGASTEESRAATTSCCGEASASGGASGGPSGGGGGGGCCGPTTLSVDDLAQQIGYSRDELAGLPEGANLGLSCGNPTALASLRAGETVVDLGSGAGFDCFLAGPRVGASGKVIGVDMTPKMLDKARANLNHYRETTGLSNIEFRLGEIEHLPLPDASADVVISNCVINLSPDKRAVWREIGRVLRPGGRAAISDLVMRKALPAPVRDMLDAWIGCVAGAPLLDDVRDWAREAGLTDFTLEEKPEYVGALENASDPLYRKMAASLPEGESIGDYVVSVNITARKPA